MSTQIRAFTDADYEASVAVFNTLFPDNPNTAAEWRHWDKHRDPKCKWGRCVAEVNGRVVGYGTYDQWTSMYHPRKFVLFLAVQPECQGQGIGAALYQHVLAELAPFEPFSVRSRAREDMTRSVRFLRERGFVDDMRVWESWLDVEGFDPVPYANVEEQVRRHGIEIRTFAELEGDPERDQKLYELDEALVADVPHAEPQTPISYEFFEENVLKDPNLLPDGFFVALDNGHYVGMTDLWKSQANNDLNTGLTGVRRDYRRKGIALALKLRAIAYAKARGTKLIKTTNESNNRPMLLINERLGFVKQPIWISFVSVLRKE